MPDDPKIADDARTRLAGERTLLAWVRTALALMGLGFVVARFGLFLRELAALHGPAGDSSPGISLWIGMALILVGVAVSVMAAWEHGRFLRHLEQSVPYRPPRQPLSIVVALLLGAIGIAMAVYLLLLGLKA